MSDIEAQVRRGKVFESPDEVTEEYRQLLAGMVRFTANSEMMGAFTERQWIPKAPSYQRKLALEAKVQDEIGHAQMEYRIVESLGYDREQLLDEFLTPGGDAGYSIAFHYPADDWTDIIMIGILIDGAAMQLQHTLQKTSYGPFNRIMRRICREEEMHLRFAEHMFAEYATGSNAQQERLQDAIDRWWPRVMIFYGLPEEFADNDHVPDSKAGHQKRLKELGIKTVSNDELRQRFLDATVPKFRRFGMTVPDEELEYDEDAEEWRYSEPDWDELISVLAGDGPMTNEHLEARKEAFEETQWVRDALSAYHDSSESKYSNRPSAAAD